MSTERRPRIDAIVRNIAEGKYDEELVQIANAIADRTEQRKEAVLKTVREVFGDGHKIVPSEKGKPKPKYDIDIVQVGSEKPAPVWGGDDPTVIDPDPGTVIAAEKPPESGLTADFESRSPTFGAIEDDKEVKDGSRTQISSD
jgi:hypothetical protein